jgi:hypothetical protein
MRRMNVCAICTAAIMGASMMMSVSAMAQEETIAIPYQQEAAWDEIAMTNDDTVSTGLNIHSTADKDSPVIGYLYQGGAAWVIEKGETWTEIYSGGLTGFVMNDYLVYGEEATGLAQSYGIEGVATTWDDVKLYADNHGGADVLDTLGTGTSFILTEDGGNWIQVQKGADDVAYVSAEDVSRVLLLDTAVAVDSDGQDSYTEDYADDSYSETYYDESYEDTYYEDSYYEESYTDTADYSETYTEPSYTEPTYEESTYTEQTESTSASQNLPVGIGYYDEYTGTYYDYYGNALYTGSAQIGYYDEYTGTYYDVYGNVMFSVSTGSTVTETPATEAAVAETEAAVTETAAAETEAASASASVSSDDATLLAALIYCEAGNQSYEGMVAVGAVVMNRVASASFPSTISDVIYQSGQFTPASSGALASALSSGVPSTCYDAAVAALNGENPVGSALYFNTGSGKGTKIGAHQFY